VLVSSPVEVVAVRRIGQRLVADDLRLARALEREFLLLSVVVSRSVAARFIHVRHAVMECSCILWRTAARWCIHWFGDHRPRPVRVSSLARSRSLVASPRSRSDAGRPSPDALLVADVGLISQ
jgi:hypothetical protein